MKKNADFFFFFFFFSKKKASLGKCAAAGEAIGLSLVSFHLPPSPPPQAPFLRAWAWKPAQKPLTERAFLWGCPPGKE